MKVERARASEHGADRGLYHVQIITLYPELVNAVRDPQCQRGLIRFHQFYGRKPPMKGIGAEMRSDFAGYFTPNSIVNLLHSELYSHSFCGEMRKRYFHPFGLRVKSAG